MSKKITGISFQEIREKVEEALKTEGFGVLTEIDFSGTMKKKLGKDYLPHVILGACNPIYADQVVSIEPHVSTLLPCNVTIRQVDDNEIEVSTISPKAAMSVVEVKTIEKHADEVEQKLINVLNQL